MTRLCSKISLVSAAAMLLALSAPATAQPFQLIGIETFATGFQFDGREVGGLSSIDYSPVTQNWVAISDDRQDPVFYNLNVTLTGTDLSVGFDRAVTILDAGNQPFAPGASDPEGIRFAPDGNSLFWSSEGDSNDLIPPFVREMNLDGTFIRAFDLPAKYVPADTPPGGVRNNNAFEPLALSVDGALLFTGTESALVQDGNRATVTSSSNARILSYDVATGTPGAEYVYPVDPIPFAPIPSGSFADNGFVELLAVSDTQLLALERSFAVGVGNTIRVFLIDLENATDVSDQDTLTTFTPVGKTLVLDLSDLGLSPDNIEGVAFGPDLADGRRTLLFVSDNNFNPAQITQFIAVAVDLDAIPVPAAAFAFATGVLGLVAARRRR